MIRMATITCDRCNTSFDVNPGVTGDRVACPYCGDINRVPPELHARHEPAVRAAAAEPTVPATGGRQAAPRPLAEPGSGAEGSGGRGEEQVLLVVQQPMFRAHPFWYSLLVLLALCGLALAIIGALGVITMVLGWIGLGLLIAAGAWWLIWWAAPRRWVKLIVTDRRTIRREGIVMRRTSEVLHRHVTNVVIEQGFLDRMLDVGYIGLDTAGMGGEPGRDGTRSGVEIEVWNIPHPYRVKEVIDRYRLH